MLELLVILYGLAQLVLAGIVITFFVSALALPFSEYSWRKRDYVVVAGLSLAVITLLAYGVGYRSLIGPLV